MRVDSILAKTAAKTASLEATYLDRDHENARIALARQLELNLRRQKVSSPAHSLAPSFQDRGTLLSARHFGAFRNAYPGIFNIE